MPGIKADTRSPATHSRGAGWRIVTAVVIFAMTASACSADNPAFDRDSDVPCLDDGPPHVGDFIGIRDLEIEPTGLSEGEAFSINWTRTAGQLITAPADTFGTAVVPGNASVTVTLDGAGIGLPASVTMPFDYQFLGENIGVELSEEETLPIASLVPNFADDLTPGTYSVEVALNGDEIPLCPPGGSGELLTANFAIDTGPSCLIPEFDLLDLAISQPTWDPAPPRTISWATSYLVQTNEPAVSPVEADITETLTIIDTATGSEVASESIVTAGIDAIHSGDVIPRFRTFGDLGITSADVGDQVTIRVEVSSEQPEDECGATDLEVNNFSEITVDVVAP